MKKMLLIALFAASLGLMGCEKNDSAAPAGDKSGKPAAAETAPAAAQPAQPATSN